MALNTPGASPLFPTGQAREQFGAYWGAYATAGTLPNTAGNILTAAQFRLEAGDTAFVTALGQYVCTSAGSATLGDAVWAATPIGPSGGVSTDNALVRWDGTSGTMLQNGVAIESDVGDISAFVGTAALPSYSFVGRTSDGVYSVGANDVGISTNGVLRFDVSTTAVTSTLPYVAPVGAVGAPSFTFTGDTTTGVYRVGANDWGVATNGVLRFDVSTTALTSTLPFVAPLGAVTTPSFTFVGDLNTGAYSVGADQYNITTGGVLGLTLAVQTTGTSPNFEITDSTRTGGAGINQIGTRFTYVTNQTGSATFVAVKIAPTISATLTGAYTALDISVTETALGSGAQYLINAKAGASGTTQKFAVSNIGQVFATHSAAATPDFSTIGTPTTGLCINAVNSISLSFSGSQWHTFSTSGTTASITAPNATTDFYVYNSQSQTTARLVLLSAAGGTNTYTASQVSATCNTAWTGSTVTQRQFGIYPGVNQTGSASFIALDINATVAALGAGSTAPVFGSGGGFAIKVSTGGTAPTLFAAVTFGGQFQGTGAVGAPSYSFVGDTTTGLFRQAASIVSFALAGAEQYRFAAGAFSVFGTGPYIFAGTAANGFTVYGNVTTQATVAVNFKNNQSFTGSATAQVLTSFVATTDQTATAAFTALQIITTETTVGSGAQLALDVQTGLGSLASITNHGGLQFTPCSPAAMAVTENDYAGSGAALSATQIVGRSFWRLTPNAANTVVTGFVSTNASGLYVIIVNLGAGTITINHQDVLSVAANRVITATGVAIVLLADDTATFLYDPTTTRWRQISSVA